jgi:hypothetical protein
MCSLKDNQTLRKFPCQKCLYIFLSLENTFTKFGKLQKKKKLKTLSFSHTCFPCSLHLRLMVLQL